jgi:hypothetical protein
VLFFNKSNPLSRHRLRIGVTVVSTAIALAAAVAGCGGSDSTSTSRSGQAGHAAPPVSKADLREAQLKSQRLAKLYERSWREYQGN